MSKKVIMDEKVREGVMRGINVVADTSKITLGSKGRAVGLWRRGWPSHITRDGVSIAKKLEDLDDPIEDFGARQIIQVSHEVNEEVGDGTTTAQVLSQAFSREGLKNVTAGFDPIGLSLGMKKGEELIREELKKMAIPVKSKEDTKNVATISSRDPIIGELISDVIDQVGKDGVVTIEESQGFSLSKEVVEGVKIDRGYISPYIITNEKTGEAIFEDPYILVTDRKISMMSEIGPLIKKLIDAKIKELVIIADDIESPILTILINNRLSFKCLAIRTPGFGDYRREGLEDLASVIGAQYIQRDLGKIEDVQIEHLGRAEKIISNKDSTVIMGGKGDKEKMKQRIDQIKHQISISDSEFDKERLKIRLAKLSGSVAVIKVGGMTEVERKEKLDRIEDALNATRSAIEEGIVPGGGVALARISSLIETHSQSIDKTNMTDLAFFVGLNIVSEGLKAPLKQIAKNAGFEGAVVLDKVLQGKDDYGFNASTGKYENLIASGVIDPAKVVRVSSGKSISMASLLLILDAIVCDEDDERKK